MNVGNVCRPDPVTIGAAEGITAAARLMREKHIGFLVVLEPSGAAADPQIAGVLTDRDIVTAVVAKEADSRLLKVGDVMTRNPLLADEAHALEPTLRHMREAGVRRVPVIGPRGQLTGVLSFDDVLQAFAEQLNDIAGAIRNEQGRERLSRP